MKPFRYVGNVATSKSLMNRALIAQSFFPELEIIGGSECDDVQKMIQALAQFRAGAKTIHAGEGGTTFRFLLARLSRQPGRWLLKADDRLLLRPHQSLLDALAKLQVKVQPLGQGLSIDTEGWQIPDKVEIETSFSSQYVSALLLNSWGLPRDLSLHMVGERPSLSYLQMTIDLLRELGLEIEAREATLRIAAGQRLLRDRIELEPDMSSIFTLACFAALLGELHILQFPTKSRQPDFVFTKMFKEMGIPIIVDQRGLQVGRAKSFCGGEWDLRQAPDLFPVLCVLLSQAQSSSRIGGIDTLAHKESDRIAKTSELLSLIGAEHQWDGKFFIIKGATPINDGELKEFDPDQDHRMAMAASLCEHLGYGIKLQHRQVVAKSFPEFFKIIGAT